MLSQRGQGPLPDLKLILRLVIFDAILMSVSVSRLPDS